MFKFFYFLAKNITLIFLFIENNISSYMVNHLKIIIKKSKIKYSKIEGILKFKYEN